MTEAMIEVFAYDGTLQCAMGEETTPDEAARDLEAAGVPVVSSRKARVPLMIPAMCGAPTGMANVLRISATHFTRAYEAGFAFWVFDANRLEVAKYDGSRQCAGGEIDIAVMERELTDVGVTVHNRRKASDGLNHITVCGAVTGMMNVYEIDGAGLGAALNAGFQLYVTRVVIKQLLGGRDKAHATLSDSAIFTLAGVDNPFPFGPQGDDPPFPIEIW